MNLALLISTIPCWPGTAISSGRSSSSAARLDQEVYKVRRGVYEQYKPARWIYTSFSTFNSNHCRATPEQLDPWHSDFMQNRRPADYYPRRAQARGRAYTGGDLCVIITATNSFVTAPIAGIKVPNLIRPEPEQKDGEFTGRVSGLPASEKARSRAWKAGWMSTT